MAGNKINRNDQAANRTDGNEPGTWPGSGTTVDGPVESATSGVFADADDDKGSASTSAAVQEPEDRRTGSGEPH